MYFLMKITMQEMFCVMLILVITLFSLNSVNAKVSDDYLNEFSISGETCQVLDSFVYDIANPWFFNSERKYTTTPIIYNCCKNESCVSIIFDGNHKTFINDDYMREIIDLNYIRYNLYNGNLSENYFEVKGLDLCNYFGFSEAKKQTLYLASDVVETGATMVGTERAYTVANTINTARKVGIIETFNPALLVAGVGCGYDNKQLNKALENIVLLNSYLKNINYGYSQEGYVKNLTNSIALSNYYLEEYLKSPTAMIRGGANWFLNAFKFLFQVSMKPTEKHEIEKTEYQLAQEVQRQVSGYHFYISNPNRESVITKNDERINLKSSQFLMNYNPLAEQFRNVSSLKPSFLKVVFTNIFFDPNYNLSYGHTCFNSAKSSIQSAEKDYNELRFNSGINSLKGVTENLTCANEIFIRENLIERNFDKLWLILIIVMGLIIFIKFKFYD